MSEATITSNTTVYMFKSLFGSTPITSYTFKSGDGIFASVNIGANVSLLVDAEIAERLREALLQAIHQIKLAERAALIEKAELEKPALTMADLPLGVTQDHPFEPDPVYLTVCSVCRHDESSHPPAPAPAEEAASDFVPF
jgi:hypothetical protein